MILLQKSKFGWSFSYFGKLVYAAINADTTTATATTTTTTTTTTATTTTMTATSTTPTTTTERFHAGLPSTDRGLNIDHYLQTRLK